MKLTLFEFQKKCVYNGMNYLLDNNNNKPQIIVAPTAAGKSIIIASLAKELNKPCLVLQPSKELLKQNLEKFINTGGEAKVFSASMKKKEIGFVTYATLGSIKKQVNHLKTVGIETLFIDEAHFKYSPSIGSEFSIFINELKPKKVIGFTATPFRLSHSINGSMLKMLTRMRPGYFKEYLHVIQISELIKENRWSKLQYEYYYFDENTLEINSSGADFTEESIKKSIQLQGINNSIYLRIIKLINDGCNSVLVFMDNIKNAEKMAFALSKKGIKASFVSGETNSKERDLRIENFKSGKIKVLLNYGVLSTGFDYPELECLILGRPTNSLSLYYQEIGRGVRVHPNKEKCLIIDFCNNFKRFGKVETIKIHNIDMWGWGVTNNNVILTNYPMSNPKITIDDLKSGKINNKGQRTNGIKMSFGIHKGKYIEDVPIPYLKWCMNNFDFKKIYSGEYLRKNIDQILKMQ